MRTILTPPGPAGAALGELKDWLAITTSTEDTALTRLLCAALESCEAFTGETLAETWAAVPQALRHGAVRFAAQLYRRRDDETDMKTPPESVAALWRAWRKLRVL